MRIIVYGAGAVGGVIGGQLACAGDEVVAIARGAHHEALRSNGLRVTTPEGSYRADVEVVGTPGDVHFQTGDVVILAMKSQDTLGAIQELAQATDMGLPVFCAQNGVANEREVLRHFGRAYGIHVVLPATFLEPGVVAVHSAPTLGLLDAGCWPQGVDAVVQDMVARFRRAGFESQTQSDIARWKYGKLLTNLGNVVDAVCSGDALGGRLMTLAQDEARRCLDAAGIVYTSVEEDRARRGDILQISDAAEQPRRGNSSWQSLARGVGRIETDYLNGEIVLLGKLAGVPTPVNELLQRTIRDLVRDGRPPRSESEEALLQRLATSDATKGGPNH